MTELRFDDRVATGTGTTSRTTPSRRSRPPACSPRTWRNSKKTGHSTLDLSIEDVRDHLAEVRDKTGYIIPGHSGEEVAEFLQTIATDTNLT